MVLIFLVKWFYKFLNDFDTNVLLTNLFGEEFAPLKTQSFHLAYCG